MRVSYAIGNTCNDKIFLLLKSDSYLSSPQNKFQERHVQMSTLFNIDSTV